MALADHLLLILLLAPQAAATPRRAQRADKASGNGQEATWQDAGLVPLQTLEQPGDPLQVNSFLAPYADLVRKLESNPTGPPRAELQDEGRITTPEPSEVLWQIVEELRRGHEMEQEAVQSEAALGGDSISRPVSAQDTVATQDTDMPVLSQPGQDQHGHVYAFYPLDSDTECSCWGPYVEDTSHNLGGTVNRACAGDKAEGESKAQVSPERGDSVPSGADKERSSSASNARASFVCPQDVRRSCMIGTAATVISMPLALVFCYCMLQRWKKS